MLNIHRREQIFDFLKKYFNSECFEILDMGLDASSRKYFRVVTTDGNTKILVDDEGCNNKPREFELLSIFLNKHGIRAPKVYVNCLEQGLMLIEDFGDTDFVRKANKENEKELLCKAVDVLVKLHSVSDCPSGIKLMDEKVILENFSLFIDWFVPSCLGKQLTKAQRESFFEIVKSLMPKALQLPSRLVLWDYHVNNIMYPDDKTAAIIDFQDAMWGPCLYDLVSLVEDERRNISSEVAEQLKEYYLEKVSCCDRDCFDKAYAYMSLLRHMRVLGRFATLILVRKKIVYAKYVPHGLELLKKCLENPDFKELRLWMDVNFSESKWGVPKDKGINKAFVLAAGRGVRMRHLTENTAKPMVYVAGRRLIDYGLDLLKNSKIKDIVVNVCWYKEDVKKYVQELSDFNVTISEEKEALETGGGIKKALEYFENEPFIVVNADNILIDDGYKPIIRQMQDAWNDEEYDIVLLLHHMGGILGDRPIYGDYKIVGKDIVRNKNKSKEGGYDFTYLGVAIIHPRIFKGCDKEKFSLVELFDKAEENRRLGYALSDRREFLVGTPEAVKEAETILLNKINP